MDMNTIKDWIVPIAAVVGLLPIVVGVWLSLREYRLKLQAETRLKNSSQVEQDIQLLKLFTEIMNIAHARGPVHVSEKAIEMLLKSDVIKELSTKGISLNSLLENAVIVYPVGVAAQDAAIASIWALAQRHEILRPVAVQALESLMGFKANIARKYLDDLNSKYPEIKIPAEVACPARTRTSASTGS